MPEPREVAAVVVQFHRRLDDVIAQTITGHGVKLACAPGCSYCCHLRVEVQPQEAFALAEWLRRRLDPQGLVRLVARLRANVEATRSSPQRGNLACSLLATDGTCSAYEARPAACRRMHSLDVAACRTAFENPLDASLEVPANAALSHNAAVIAAQAQQATRGDGLDADSVEMNFALLEALDNPKAWRRWRDGKKPFPAAR